MAVGPRPWGAAVTADWRALQGAIDGEVVLQGMPEYESVRKPVMARFEQVRPVALVRCATPADVDATLAVAPGQRLPTAIRSGGHSVAGRSSTDGVVLDVTPMRSVAVAGQVATVVAGVRLGRLYLVHPWGSGGVYPNFPDPDLHDWAQAYHGINYDRLRRVKATYDPGGFFRYHQSLS